MRSISLEDAGAEAKDRPGESLAQVTSLRLGARSLPADASPLSMDCNTGSQYRVSLSDSLLSPGSTGLQEAIGDRKALLITTPTVNRLYGAAMRGVLAKTNTVATLILDVSEASKSMELVQVICQAALEHGLNRRGLLLGFGGGVCLDLVTMAASLIRRGIGHLRVPTTLIGQIDAGIGLKGAVNFCGKKSFIGCFHPPEQVLIDPAFLQSLPQRHLSAGTAEALKMGIVRDPALFELLERFAPTLVASRFAAPAGPARELLRRAIFAMLDELRKNPYEDQGYERLVDFGHTFSPVLESALGFDIQHGEAVAVDMALSAAIADSLGLLAPGDCGAILRALKCASLPVYSPRLDLPLCREGLIEASRHRGGAMNLVVPTAIGSSVFLKHREDLPDSLLEGALSRLAAAEREAA